MWDLVCIHPLLYLTMIISPKLLMHYPLDAQIFVYALEFFFPGCHVPRESSWVLIETKSGLRNMYYLCPWTWDFKNKGIR